MITKYELDDMRFQRDCALRLAATRLEEINELRQTIRWMGGRTQWNSYQDMTNGSCGAPEDEDDERQRRYERERYEEDRADEQHDRLLDERAERRNDHQRW